MKTEKSMMMLLLALLVCNCTTQAGDLNPPAAPDSTMKTLDEVEPRIPINDENTPGDLNYKYKITQPGSYYLTGDVETDVRALSIACGDVTVDLNGYALRYTGTGSHWGVIMYGDNNIEIRNGTIEGFNQALYDNTVNGVGQRILSVHIRNCDLYGMMLKGSGVIVQDCVIEGNGINNTTAFAAGIFCGNKAVIRDNYISGNGGNCSNYVYGIYADGGSMVTGNTITDNAASAQNNFYGIWVGTGSVIAGNVCYNNAANAIDKSKELYGIMAEAGSVIKDNAVYQTGTGAEGTAYGISANGYCLISNNACYLNKDYNLSAAATCVLDNNVAPAVP